MDLTGNISHPPLSYKRVYISFPIFLFSFSSTDKSRLNTDGFIDPARNYFILRRNTRSVHKSSAINTGEKGQNRGERGCSFDREQCYKIKVWVSVYIYAYIYVGSCLVNSCVNTAVLCVRFCTLRGFRSKSTFPPARRVTFKLKSRNVVKRSARDTAERV